MDGKLMSIPTPVIKNKITPKIFMYELSIDFLINEIKILNPLAFW